MKLQSDIHHSNVKAYALNNSIRKLYNRMMRYIETKLPLTFKNWEDDEKTPLLNREVYYNTLS